MKFVQEQTEDSVIEYKNLEELTKLDEKKRYLIGYFDTKESKEYETFRYENIPK